MTFMNLPAKADNSDLCRGECKAGVQFKNDCHYNLDQPPYCKLVLNSLVEEYKKSNPTQQKGETPGEKLNGFSPNLSRPNCNSNKIEEKFQDQKFTDGRLDILKYSKCIDCNFIWRPGILDQKEISYKNRLKKFYEANQNE